MARGKASAVPKRASKAKAATNLTTPAKGKQAGGAKKHAVAQLSSFPLGDAIVPLAKAPPGYTDKSINNQVDRLFRAKLKSYEKDELRTVVGKVSRLSVHEYLYNSIAELKGTNKNPSSKFWTVFYKEFGLSSSMFAGLPALVSGDAEPDGELLAALLEVRNENPTKRKTEPFQQWLAYSPGDCTQDELILALHSSLPGDRVSTKHHEEMLMALLKHIGMHKLHEKFDRVWRAVSEDCDSFLHKVWAATATKDEDRSTWVLAHRHVLSCFLDMSLVREVMDDADSERPDTAEKFTPIFKTKIGAGIFKSGALKVQFTGYLATIDKQLHEVEMENFTDEVVDGFRRLMLQQTRLLVGAGHNAWDKKQEHMIEFLGEQVPIEYCSLNDHWSYRLEARLRSLAVHINLVERLPWETVLFGDDPVEGLPSHVHIDEGLLEDTKNSRKAICAVFSKLPGPHTFSEMRKIVHSQLYHLKGYDKHLRLEFGFIESVAERVAENRVGARIVGLFPLGMALDAKSIATVLAGISELRKSDLLASCSVKVVQDIEAVHKLVSNIGEGVPASDISVSRMSECFVGIMTLAENYCTHTITKNTGKAPVQTVVYGKKALAAKWDEFIKKKGSEQAMATRELKTFSWMLTDAQMDNLRDVVRNAVVAARGMVLQTNLALKDSSEGAGAAGAAGGQLAHAQVSANGGGENSAAGSGSNGAIVPAAASSASASDPGASGSHNNGSLKKRSLSDKDCQRQSLLALFKKRPKTTTT